MRQRPRSRQSRRRRQRQTSRRRSSLLHPSRQVEFTAHCCVAPTQFRLHVLCCESLCCISVKYLLQWSIGAARDTSAGGRVVASPYAKKLAREAGVDVSDATPTGLGGRIVAADVEQLVKSGAPLSRVEHTGGCTCQWINIGRPSGRVHTQHVVRSNDVSCAMAHQLLHSHTHSQRVSGGLFSDKQVPVDHWTAARPRARARTAGRPSCWLTWLILLQGARGRRSRTPRGPSRRRPRRRAAAPRCAHPLHPGVETIRVSHSERHHRGCFMASTPLLCYNV